MDSWYIPVWSSAPTSEVLVGKVGKEGEYDGADGDKTTQNIFHSPVCGSLVSQDYT
ncbi:hypothetical protein M404DRAFT_1003081 [Pisolithus tinctorius Marx 270]|uniref:Uncharacterized protein n=1 Tax=Pisolithus tinctorius Marx 270 TaxID=870435 RepID=A0A0C3P269_PISTI|nr:hypothetical protein M404DRAFT_1003081 [Pisolithus tinctorius Marx 270]